MKKTLLIITFIILICTLLVSFTACYEDNKKNQLEKEGYNVLIDISDNEELIRIVGNSILQKYGGIYLTGEIKSYLVGTNYDFKTKLFNDYHIIEYFSEEDAEFQEDLLKGIGLTEIIRKGIFLEFKGLIYSYGLVVPAYRRAPVLDAADRLERQMQLYVLDDSFGDTMAEFKRYLQQVMPDLAFDSEIVNDVTSCNDDKVHVTLVFPGTNLKSSTWAAIVYNQDCKIKLQHNYDSSKNSFTNFSISDTRNLNVSFK